MAKKIMLVEDDPLLAIVEEKLITKLGYKVVGKAQSGEEALRIISEIDPDIVIMDVQLAGDLDGIETTLQLHEKHQELPVIFLSGDDNAHVLHRAKQAGCIDFLLKPVSLGALSEPLEKAVKTLSSQTNFAA
ncbi:response regulator [Gracilimonas mengyeensis]|nr:response regulator [Gracilimonas mengyeensis]